MNQWHKRVSSGNISGDYAYFLKNYQRNVDSRHIDLLSLISINIHGLYKPDIYTKEYRDYSQALKGRFYFRTAYRNDPEFNLSVIKRQPNPTDELGYESLLKPDQKVSSNYQRLVGLTIENLFDVQFADKKVSDVRDEVINEINQSLKRVFDDLELTSLGNPVQNGSFYFTKGVSKNFDYKNLSAGEKGAFDLILDFIIKKAFYKSAIYCIDEPEVHMHTDLQGKLFVELVKILPDDSQMWISTHSLGILSEAKKMNDINHDTIAFINFDNKNFDEYVEISPANVDKVLWRRFIEIALGDFSSVIAPKTVIFCEGDPSGVKNKNFDSQVYIKIFGNYFSDISFVSIGSSNDLKNQNNVGIQAIKQVLSNTKIKIITDRDEKSPEEVQECIDQGINVLKERHLESYLLDDEIIIKLCLVNNRSYLIESALQLKKDAIVSSIARGRSADDIKSAAGEIYVGLKRLLQLRASGSDTEAFLRDTMAALVTQETEVFKKLREEVIGV